MLATVACLFGHSAWTCAGFKKEYPGPRQFAAVEDSDPTDNTSKQAIDAKKHEGLKVFTIPHRSPDLNVLDYALWAEVEKFMRKQECSFEEGKFETR